MSQFNTQAQATGHDGRVLAGILTSEGRLDRVLTLSLAQMEAEMASLPEGHNDTASLSRARIQALIAEGQVQINGKLARDASAKVRSGCRFRLHLPPPVASIAAPQDIPLSIVYEDRHLLVVDKPAGLVVHPAAGNLDGTLVNALLHHCEGGLSGIGGVARPGIVHRIDKDTSGLLVVAKSDIAHEGLARQFAAHSIERAYLALVAGWPMPAEATLRGVIARSAHDRKKMALLEPHEASRRGKRAVTHYRVVERLGQGANHASAHACALVECRLETGRTHQVRVHMASIDHGLLGDSTYGNAAKAFKALLYSQGFARQALHAAVLGFIHPVSDEAVRFVSPLPEDMRTLLCHLRGEPD